MKTYLLSFIAAVSLFSCQTKENTLLQAKVDSLNNALIESKKLEVVLSDVGIMLDTIDASHRALRINVVEGISYSDYIDRLKEINSRIKESQEKLASMEKELKNSKGASSAAIRVLKDNLNSKAKEIVALQLDVLNLRDQNKTLTSNVLKRDSALSNQSDIIMLRNSSIDLLEAQAHDDADQNRMKVADLYYAQAKALELAADRTRLAPNKKKETRREALELYKLSMSMGNIEAESRIQKLEKELS